MQMWFRGIKIGQLDQYETIPTGGYPCLMPICPNLLRGHVWTCEKNSTLVECYLGTCLKTSGFLTEVLQNIGLNMLLISHKSCLAMRSSTKRPGPGEAIELTADEHFSRFIESLAPRVKTGRLVKVRHLLGHNGADQRTNLRHHGGQPLKHAVLQCLCARQLRHQNTICAIKMPLIEKTSRTSP